MKGLPFFFLSFLVGGVGFGEQHLRLCVFLCAHSELLRLTVASKLLFRRSDR